MEFMLKTLLSDNSGSIPEPQLYLVLHVILNILRASDTGVSKRKF